MILRARERAAGTLGSRNARDRLNASDSTVSRPAAR
jgi:hypothetical protein